VEKIKGAIEGSWIQCASSRTVLTRKDDAHVGDLLKMLSLSPFLGILGQVNLAEIDDMDPNDFYRAYCKKLVIILCRKNTHVILILPL